MKNIEIKTTQNVVLQYELADLRDRAIAFFIDIVCLTISLTLLLTVGLSIFSFSETAQTVVQVFLSCVFIFYSLAFEMLNKGQSIGKMAMRIQVIKMEGGNATFSDYAARWVFRLIDIYFSLGGIASILIASSPKAQRIGDVVATTAVIKMVPKMDLTLQDLLALHEKKTYTPQYMQARQLHEEDALLIKSTLDRYRKFDNDAHSDAITQLAKKLKQVLGLDEVQGDDQRFLQTLLQDYVILTR